MSLNKGIFFTFKTMEEKENCLSELKKLILDIEGIANCLFMDDEEIINVSATLASDIKKAMAEVQTGAESSDEKSVFENPEFLEKFTKSIVINTTTKTTVTKLVFVDRTNSRNIQDTELIQIFMKLTGILKHDGILHIPGNADKLAQLNLFYKASSNTLRIERNGIGCPAIKLFICKNLSPEEAEKHEGKDKLIKELTFPYNGVAQTYDDMLSFVIDEEYDELNLGISRNSEDVPVLTTCKSLEELYDIISLMVGQMEFYGILERDVIDVETKQSVMESTAE